MTLFFPDIDKLNQFTLQLDYDHGTLQCEFCFKQDQFISHGFVYKNQHLQLSGEKEIVGKRVLCSDRHGHSGCGHTRQLYLVHRVPSLHRTALQLTAFFLALIAGLSIQQAYVEATHTADPRHAYRWLAKCQQQLVSYRQFFTTRSATAACSFLTRVRRLQILLPTLARLREHLDAPFCALYQLHQQHRFL